MLNSHSIAHQFFKYTILLHFPTRPYIMSKKVFVVVVVMGNIGGICRPFSQVLI